MTKLEQLWDLFEGIDCTETTSDKGWWQAGVEAEFGARKMFGLISLLNSWGVDLEVQETLEKQLK